MPLKNRTNKQTNLITALCIYTLFIKLCLIWYKVTRCFKVVSHLNIWFLSLSPALFLSLTWFDTAYLWWQMTLSYLSTHTHTHTHTHIYIYIERVCMWERDTYSIMITLVGDGHDDLSSILGWGCLHFI